MDSAHAVSIAGVGSSTPLDRSVSNASDDISGNTSLGLKLENDFTMEELLRSDFAHGFA